MAKCVQNDIFDSKMVLLTIFLVKKARNFRISEKSNVLI